MPVTLPPRIDGTPSPTIGPGRQTVIIGANGAGKTRFARRLGADIAKSSSPRPIFNLSALKALYDTRPASDSVDTLYEATVPETRRDPGATQLDRLMALLVHDEMVNLFSYKAAHAAGMAAKLQPTRLDSVIALWQEMFPDNRILISSGKMLFSRPDDSDSTAYSAPQLSAGEKAVIYYIGAALYAPKGAVVMVESPEMFLHPSLMQSLWNRIELLRRDCAFVYVTHDLDFASSRSDASAIWVRRFDPSMEAWDYELMPPHSPLADGAYLAIMGSRKPVLFIEGDGIHSIDAHLYPLIFKDYSVQSLGSCNKVIEAVRTFNDLSTFHHLDSRGIVDRDRRDNKEVSYLRARGIMVPDVAEIENILMLEEVVRAVASFRRKDEGKVFQKVKASIVSQFRNELRAQALMHTRHRVKRLMEYRVDGRFANINTFEEHISQLAKELNPRGLYEDFCRQFRSYVAASDYASILRVYNQKSMLPASNVAGLCGLKGKDDYIKTILQMLRDESHGADRIRRAVSHCFGLDAPATNVNKKTE
ncbi:MAG: DUF4435 domain-containing protein [Pseudoflavonifractor sp.]|nr:DUF4435 domain-containing protein [Alloprevotella sp.]MCM1115963.1 DUF4435 domain-containing protein [Pseudoflavonifractor sp.]